MHLRSSKNVCGADMKTKFIDDVKHLLLKSFVNRIHVLEFKSTNIYNFNIITFYQRSICIYFVSSVQHTLTNCKIADKNKSLL